MTNHIPSPFKLIAESLGLSVADAANLLGATTGTARKWAANDRTVPNDIIRKAEGYFQRVEAAAEAYKYHPERLEKSALPEVLHRACRRRMMEMRIVELRDRKFQDTGENQ